MEWIISLTVAAVFCVFYYIRKKQKLEKRFHEYQNKVTNRQLTEVSEVYQTMRGWRHDYHNHLQVMKAYLEMNQYREMKDYLNLLEQDLDRIKINYNSGKINLDAILNSKLSLAEKDEIQINCKTEITGNISVEDTDLCNLIGNLIDNAVEACQKVQNESDRTEQVTSGKVVQTKEAAVVHSSNQLKKAGRFLRIYICTRRSQLYISVTNSTNEVIRKLDQDYITNKRGNHGHGLKRIDLVVEKYGGYIRRANEPGVFTTEIMLPLEEDKVNHRSGEPSEKQTETKEIDVKEE